MSLLEILQLVGYSTAAALHLLVGALLLRRRRALGKIERVLMPLAFAVGVWHASNLFVTLHEMLGLAREGWTAALRAADTLAVVSVTLTYSFLLHVHLHLWADARHRPLNFTERARVYLSYVPVLFLAYAVPKIWSGGYAPMFEKLSNLLLPFALWAAYVLCLVAVTDFLIARLNPSRSERRLMLTLAASFLAIAALILGVYALGFGAGTPAGAYLATLANLGSLLPTALLAYHIYRYRYLELIFKESLIVASFAAVVLVVYLYGIRTFALWLTARYGLRAAAVEALMILMLALVASPLRRWLDRRFRELFVEETALVRDVASRVGASAGRYRQLPELLRFVEERAAEGLGLRRVRLLVTELVGEGESEADEESAWAARVLERSREAGWRPVEAEPLLGERGYEIAFPLRRERREVGVMLVDAAPDALTYDVRAVLEMLAGQVAIAVEDARLVEENVSLERRIAQSERLASLGRMAATVAHEVKNPLSAIKSIAQVMREDERVSGEYGRDLSLIIGEADRLSRSVTQMLSFARTAPHGESPRRADELVAGVLELFRGEAAERRVTLRAEAAPTVELDGPRVAALRDALSNLVLNAIQATPAGGSVRVEARADGPALLLAVTDAGPGVPDEQRERIWEPFFTTKQRGTGLGLAIVRKRIEEVGGAARLAAPKNGGARFELTVPLSSAGEPDK
ncbi:MAG TPA: ATP-binding protein [Pyrinomonadaceae bacterium]|nr:ATP-binding protein [Pyrinomonadaceae bacterium]